MGVGYIMLSLVDNSSQFSLGPTKNDTWVLQTCVNGLIYLLDVAFKFLGSVRSSGGWWEAYFIKVSAI